MSLLNRLFGGNNTPVKTAEPLDENLFWSIVEESVDKTENQDEQQQCLITRLQQLTPAQMIGFRLRTDKLLYDTYTSEMWCAAYIMNGGCSDDGFEYFRCWVISRGREVYYNAKADADTLVGQACTVDDFEFESFWYVANEAFEAKTGKDLYDYIDDDGFKFREGSYPDIRFTWKEEDPESMRVICPNLFDKMWDKW